MVTTDTLWQNALTELQIILSVPVFKTWFSQTSCIELSEEEIIIGCPNNMVCQQLDQRYRKTLEETIAHLAGHPLHIRFIVQDRHNSHSSATPLFDQLPEIQETAANSQQPGLNSYSTINPSPTTHNPQPTTFLNPNYTFDQFVVGNSNRIAHAAALAITDHPGTSYNPFFLYGGTGVGKTHLVQAIGNALLSKQPNSSVLYCSIERFMNDFIDSIRFKTTNEFKTKYRSCNVLIVDDIQFIAGNKESTQEEFFHTFNELHASGRQIILCSDRPPRDIASLTDRLVSRFEGGLTVEVAAPDFETRSAIIRAKADHLGLALTPEIADYLASTAPDNIRSLEGVILQLQSRALSTQQPLTLDLARSILGDHSPTPVTRLPNPNELLKLICETYGITLKDLTGKKRIQSLVTPRQLAMYLLRQDLGLNLETIGQLLGGRDHTTVMHGIDKVSKLATTDTQTRSSITAIRQATLR